VPAIEPLTWESRILKIRLEQEQTVASHACSLDWDNSSLGMQTAAISETPVRAGLLFGEDVPI